MIKWPEKKKIKQLFIFFKTLCYQPIRREKLHFNQIFFFEQFLAS